MRNTLTHPAKGLTPLCTPLFRGLVGHFHTDDGCVSARRANGGLHRGGPVDHGGEVPGAEAVVYVDHADSRRAAVEHRQQGGETLEAGPVSDTGGDGDHRYAGQSADDRRERAIHSGDHDYDSSAADGGHLPEEPVKACHSDVEQALDLAVHQLSGDRGLRRDGQVGGTGARDYDAGRSLAVGPAVGHYGPGGLFVQGVGYDLPDGVEYIGRRAGDQEPVRGLEDFRGDGGYLLRRLALREDHLREAGAHGAVVVDLREVEIPEREDPQLVDDIVGAEAVVLEAVEQRPEAGLVYLWPPYGTGGEGRMRRMGRGV